MPQVSPAKLMPSRSLPTPGQRRRKMSPQAGEVIGQCSRCLDFFTVTILRSGDQLYVEETPRLVWQYIGARQFELQHRPGVCGGKVKLYYGSAERLLPESTSARDQLRPPATAPVD